MNKTLSSFVVATGLTAVSYALGEYYKWIDPTTTPFMLWLEIFSVWTSYSCTFLCIYQSRINYLIGAVSVAALGLLFYYKSDFASLALQTWLFPALLYGWFRWGPDLNTRPVTTLSLDWTLTAYAGVTAFIYGLCYWINNYMGGSMASLDAAILVLSILAQFMMDNKKLENWFVWIVVDIISVYEYAGQGMPILAIQMGLFGLNAVWGLYEWRKTQIASRVALKNTTFVAS